MSTVSPPGAEKVVVLGSALWGWGIEREGVMALLDEFAVAGGGLIDTAVNYPIDKRAEDFGLALRLLAEWLAASARSGVEVIVKVGAIDNQGGDAIDLSPESIRRTEGTLRAQLGDALSVVCVHWDNRGLEQDSEIAATVREFERLRASGLKIGLSGIRCPEAYLRAAPELAAQWQIQVKENVLTNSARMAYLPWFKQASYLAYGINMGGVKPGANSSSNSVRLRNVRVPDGLTERLVAFLASNHGLSPAPGTLNELALLMAYANPAISGVVAGPRDVDQLRSTWRFWRRLQRECDLEAARRIPSFNAANES